MWNQKISIICLLFATWADLIESSLPGSGTTRSSRGEKLPIRRSTRISLRQTTQHPPSQSPESQSSPNEPSQPAFRESISPVDRNPDGPEFHSSPSHPHAGEIPHVMHSDFATSSALAAESSHRSRSRSPPGQPPPYSSLFGTKIEDLRFQRYYPVKNPSRELVIRMYDFRRGTQIYLKDNTGRIDEPLIGVHFVLSGVNGDALALVEKKKTSKTNLRGLFMPPCPRGLRAKVNIFTHQVSAIEKQEADDTPLGKTTISEYLTKETVDVPFENFFPSDHTSISIAPFPKLFGITMDQLPFYRFFPVRNPSLELGIQKYTFSPDSGIHLKIENQDLDPEKLTGEQYTLSDMKGNAVALVQKTISNHSIIRGLFVPSSSGSGDRVKINIFTGSVRFMDEVEIYNIPLANNKEVRKWYDIKHAVVKFSPRRKSG